MEIIKNLSTILMFLTCVCFSYQVVYPALSLVQQPRRFRATPFQLLRAVFSYPVYILSFIPITVLALFKKFEWQPVAHHVAISVSEL